MKNNEILVTVNIYQDGTNRIFSFLVLKDVTLKELIEGIYYGLSKKKEESYTKYFDCFEEYLKTHNQLIVEYRSKMGFFTQNDLIDFTKTVKESIDSLEKEEFKKKEKFDKYFESFYFDKIKGLNDEEINNLKDEIAKKLIYDLTIDELGFVTATQIVIDNSKKFIDSPHLIFPENTESYVIKENDLEYNISTRRINVVEPSIIEIQPAGSMPQIDKSIAKGALLTSVLSIGLGIGMRYVMTKIPDIQERLAELFNKPLPDTSSVSSSAYGSSMILMSVGMGLVSAITMLVNSSRQNKKIEEDAKKWKKNYEQYIIRTINNIVKYQKQDIMYLNTVYPQMNELFISVEKVDSVIFSRSQSDDDFLSISLGISEQITPLFEIKYEKKNLIIDDTIRYKLSENQGYAGNSEECPFDFELIIPDAKDNKKGFIAQIKYLIAKIQHQQDDVNSNMSSYPLISDIAYNFANNRPVDSSKTDRNVTQNSVLKHGFKYLKNYVDSKSDSNKPPLLFELSKCGALGVISENYNVSLKFIRHIIFELSFYHSPENLQFVLFFKQDDDYVKQSEIIKYYRFLPHANEMFENMSQFVFDKESAGNAFSNLLSIFNERKGGETDNEEESNKKDEKYTHVVCIFFDDYDIKETGFSRFLPEPPKQGEEFKNQLGLTFIFLQDQKGKLPKYCGSTIDLSSDSGILRNRYNILTREVLPSDGKQKTPDTLVEKKEFKGNYLFTDSFSKEVLNGEAKKVNVDDEFQIAYRRLSAIYYKRIAENGKVPSVVSLFEIWGIKEDEITDEIPDNSSPIVKRIENYWDKSDITKGLDVPIGKNEHGVTILNMHQNGDGPHGLVAGTTGSGKSETLITYVIGCCMKFKPEDLNFMLVDMKGGGFSDRLGRLPHLVGAVTNTTGEDEGIAAEYMLKRFLETLNSEIKRREIVLKELDTDNIDSYIKARREVIKNREKIAVGEITFESIKNNYINKENRYQACNPTNPEPKPLAHLLLIVDEFTELKRFSNDSNGIDFIKDITTIARVGRTLGFHIILVSQNIEGAITEDIRVNSKARICLKVATKSASKDMIGTHDAAAATMPGNGRAYILVGTGSRYEYFQSAYTAANRNMSIKPAVKLTYVPQTGTYETDFYNSSDDNLRMKENGKQVNPDDTQLNYIISAIEKIALKYKKAVQLFLPPLKADEKSVLDDTEWE